MASRIAKPETAFATSRRAKESKEIRDPRHLAWIRTLPCAVTGRHGCEAAHISFADRRYAKPERGKGKKAGDDWAVPLSPEMHRDQHASNEKAWWEARGIDATALATRLWAVSGNTEEALLLLESARPRFTSPRTQGFSERKRT